MRRLVFLDIDGVINHSDWFRARGRGPRHGDADHHYRAYVKWSMDPECIERLNVITDLSGAQIVLSSSWRHNRTWQDTARAMKAIGMRGTMIGRTPIDPEVDAAVFERYRGRKPHMNEPYPRGYEIQQWIDENSAHHARIVILDDDSDMEHLGNRLVRTDFDRGGLQHAHVQRAIRMLEQS